MPSAVRLCQRCQTRLTHRQCCQRTQRYCSRRCARIGSPNGRANRQPVALLGVLAILESNRDWLMTTSDLALWTFGFDDPAECHAIHMQITRLRQRGYQIEIRFVPWAGLAGTIPHGYRLVGPASESAVAA